MIEFEFADLHCHPTLKSYGRSFDNPENFPVQADIWYQKKPDTASLFLQRLTGITRFSQADFKSMASARVRYAFVSLYPFEKSFFFGRNLPDRVAARIASWVTSIGYRRVRHIQGHRDYFEDLMGEFRFLQESAREHEFDGYRYSWGFLGERSEHGAGPNRFHVQVVPTIEGAHILNTGLLPFGRPTNRQEVFDNIRQLKLLPHPPLFITLAHNFNNELCGHAPSLQSLEGMVDQSENMGAGFSPLGWETLERLLDPMAGNPIYIDLKHMSLASRNAFYSWHRDQKHQVPFLVSHGAFTGCGFGAPAHSASCFAHDEINFYDEELVILAQSGGVFGLQLDAKRLAPGKSIRKSILPATRLVRVRKAAEILWNQIRHAAEVLDAHGLPAWDTLCIGSDFDGTINPLDGVWSAREFNLMANTLLQCATSYLDGNPPLTLRTNREVPPESLIRKFAIGNAERFLNKYWKRGC